MAHPRQPRRPMPLLSAGTAYEAADFETFVYSGALLPGSKPILRLNLKNGTIIDLPTTDQELQHLLVVLCDAFPVAAVSHLKARGRCGPMLPPEK